MLLTLAPLAQSIWVGNRETTHVFLISLFIFGFMATVGLSIRPLKLFTTWLHHDGISKHGEFLFIIAFVIFTPALASIPFAMIVPELGWMGAYFEMVSAITTTGATLLVEETVYPKPLILWRSLVGAYGGWAVIVLSAAILSPRGFDGRSLLPPGYRADITLDTLQNRLALACRRYFKLYFGGLAVGTFCFVAVGNTTYHSFLLAITGIATCGFRLPGIDGVGTLEMTQATEMILFALMLYGAFLPIVMVWSTRHRMRREQGVLSDPEIKLGLGLILVVSAIVFLRHWFGAVTLESETNLTSMLEAAWGTLFTVGSFATTTGVESADWAKAYVWSGLVNPALLLLFLSFIGGAASSNTGGIKLIRVLHLFHQSAAELSKLAMPNQVPKVKWAPYSSSTLQGSLQITWVFFMLFIIIFAFGLCTLTLMGLNFESAVVVAMSSLTNTGPAFSLFSVDGLEYRAFRAPVQGVLCLLMVLGRIETLVFIAFLNPHHWLKDR